MALRKPTTAVKEIMEKIKMDKPLAKQLSNFKVVYCRPEDGRDSIVIRNCFPTAKFNCFGVAGREDMEYVLHSLLAIIDVNIDKLRGECNGKWIEEVLECIKVDDRSKMRKVTMDEPHGKIEIRLTNSGKIEMLNLIELSVKRDCQNGIYLYISEALKLVKHMANELDIGDSRITDRFSTIKDIKDDNFF